MIKELIDSLILEFTTLKGPSLVVTVIIFVGYILKMLPRFPNRYIPVVSFVLGPLMTPFMVSWPSAGEMPPGLRWPEIAAWLTTLCTGLLLACLAWIVHGQVLRKLIDDKVPALNPGRKTEETVEVETHSDAAGTATKTTQEKVTTETKPADKPSEKEPVGQTSHLPSPPVP